MDLRLTASEGFEFKAAADAGGEKLPTFRMIAYTGVPMRLDGWPFPVVLDLDTAKAPNQSVPVPRDHDPKELVGHTTAIKITSKRIEASGVFSGENEYSAEAVRLAANGFPWQASVGADGGKKEFVDAGKTVFVNGRNIDGPVYVYRGATVRELSLCPMGADGGTSVSMAASYCGWLKGRGLDAGKLSFEEHATLQATYDAEQITPAKQTYHLAAETKAEIDNIMAEFRQALIAGQRMPPAPAPAPMASKPSPADLRRQETDRRNAEETRRRADLRAMAKTLSDTGLSGYLGAVSFLRESIKDGTSVAEAERVLAEKYYISINITKAEK
jgi:hypothetical protein